MVSYLALGCTKRYQEQKEMHSKLRCRKTCMDTLFSEKTYVHIYSVFLNKKFPTYRALNSFFVTKRQSTQGLRGSQYLQSPSRPIWDGVLSRQTCTSCMCCRRSVNSKRKGISERRKKLLSLMIESQANVCMTLVIDAFTLGL